MFKGAVSNILLIKIVISNYSALQATVKQEVTSALQELGGVENKDDLEALLIDLGMSVKKDNIKHEVGKSIC